MSIEVVTYANKSQGMFEDLVNNEFGVPVTVLGWGTKWNGYSDKSKGVIKHLEKKRDDDLVVFVDGFDSKINRIPDGVAEIFKECGCKVLMSKDPRSFEFLMTKELIFGSCTSNSMANAGMYMGYAKELREMLVDEAAQKCTDDQVNLNTLCKKYDYIKVDEDNKIFKNFGPFDKNYETDAYFVSFPGSPSWSRYSRAVLEYTQFMYIYVMCALILGLVFTPKNKSIILPILLAYTAMYVFMSDKSCTKTV